MLIYWFVTCWFCVRFALWYFVNFMWFNFILLLSCWFVLQWFDLRLYCCVGVCVCFCLIGCLIFVLSCVLGLRVWRLNLVCLYFVLLWYYFVCFSLIWVLVFGFGLALNTLLLLFFYCVFIGLFMYLNLDELFVCLIVMIHI